MIDSAVARHGARAARAAPTPRCRAASSGEQTQIIADAPGVRDAGTDGPLGVGRAVRHRRRAEALDRHRRQRAAPRRAADGVRGPARARRIVEGRRFEPGRNEVIVGRAATARVRGLEVGMPVRWGENEWKVVGIFEADGAASESEIWTDASVLQPRLPARQLVPVGSREARVGGRASTRSRTR